ncbi:MAG: threonine ammonia-lyase [Bdellovibrionota bacterium]
MKALPFESILKAEERVRSYIIETPLLQSFKLQKILGWDAPVFLKVETLQFTGSFKVRGAANKILSLVEQGKKPAHVVASSAGNHAQAVAFIAEQLNIPATIVMPEGAPLVKVKSTEEYGANVVLHGAIYDQAYERAQELLGTIQDSVFIHPYEDAEIIAGQGTLGIEVMRQLSQFNVDPSSCDYIVPIGGGGQFGGFGSAVKSQHPKARFFGVVADAAPSMAHSFQNKKLTLSDSRARTLAEGLSVKKPTQTMFELVSCLAQEVGVVTDENISQAIFLLMEKLKLVVEGAGAAGVAAVLCHKIQASKDRPLVFSLCGGNIDLPKISNIIERGLHLEKRWLRLQLRIEDRPGELSRVTHVLGQSRASVLEVIHDRLSLEAAPGETLLNIHLEARGEEHAQQIVLALKEAGYHVKVVD